MPITRYWRISSGTRSNLEKGLDLGTWGAISDTLTRLKVGELVAFYASPKDEGFIAIGRVTRESHIDRTPIWPDGTYPYRIGFEVLLRRRVPVSRWEVLDRLDQKHFSHRQPRSLTELTKVEFAAIVYELKQPEFPGLARAGATGRPNA